MGAFSFTYPIAKEGLGGPRTAVELEEQRPTFVDHRTTLWNIGNVSRVGIYRRSDRSLFTVAGRKTRLGKGKSVYPFTGQQKDLHQKVCLVNIKAKRIR